MGFGFTSQDAVPAEPVANMLMGTAEKYIKMDHDIAVLNKIFDQKENKQTYFYTDNIFLHSNSAQKMQQFPFL